MITGELKSRIDKLWTDFWTGGITNPLTVIEQITFLMFARLLDITETRNEKRASRTGKAITPIFSTDQQSLRWSHFKNLRGEEMLPLVRDGVFPHFKTVKQDGAKLGEYMKDAQLMIQKPALLVSAVTLIEKLPLTEGDTKGDLYEYLLSKLTTAGINGQFRTPRHIIRLMVEMLAPGPEEFVVDPACGTGGFLVGVLEHLFKRYSSPEGVITSEETGEKIYTGDLLEPYRAHINGPMLNGYDFDATMLRVSGMNLLLHGVDAPQIHYQDTLSANFTDHFPKEATEHFDVVLANPPFKGNLDEESIHPSLLRVVKTKKTELLFIALMLRMLKQGGRCAVIVPDGVLFGSSNAHQALRKKLIEENELQAVISLPSGVFKPYAGVSTAILFFTKGGRTDHVWFYDVEEDGWSRDDKRTPLLSDEKLGPTPSTALTTEEHAKNNLADVLVRWRSFTSSPLAGEGRSEGALSFNEIQNTRTAQSFCVPKADIVAEGYDLSINRYKEVVHEEVNHRAPKEILDELAILENEIQKGMKALREMIG